MAAIDNLLALSIIFGLIFIVYIRVTGQTLGEMMASIRDNMVETTEEPLQ